MHMRVYNFTVIFIILNDLIQIIKVIYEFNSYDRNERIPFLITELLFLSQNVIWELLNKR